MKFNRLFVVQAVALNAALSGGAAVASAAPVAKKAAISMRQVKTVWHRRAVGNSYFNARLRAELARQGFRFVPKAADADAILESKGRYTARGFIGKMTFFDQNGRTIRSESVLRPANSRIMAYQQLAQKMRAVRR